MLQIKDANEQCSSSFNIVMHSPCVFEREKKKMQMIMIKQHELDEWHICYISQVYFFLKNEKLFIFS